MRKFYLLSCLLAAFCLINTSVYGQSGSNLAVQSAKTVATCNADAGLNTSFCGLSGTLDATGSIGGDGLWTYSGSTPVTFSNPNSPTTNVSVDDFGVYVFTYTIDTPECYSQDDVVVEFGDAPSAADAGSNQIICGLTYNLNGNDPAVGDGVWSGDGLIDNPNQSSTSVTAADYGVAMFIWTVRNCNCPVERDTVYINFQAPTEPHQQQTAAVCGLSYSVAGDEFSTEGGMWDANGAPVTFSDMNSLATTINASDFGTYTVFWVETNECGSSSTPFVISFNESGAVANAGGNMSTCSSYIQLNGNAPFVGVGTWSGDGVFSNPNDPDATVTINSPVVGNNYTFTWTVDTGCDQASDDVTITFLAPPTVDAGASMSVCGLTHPLGATKPEYCQGQWSSADGMISFGSPNFPTSSVTALQPGTYTLTWTVDCGGDCSSSDTVDITFEQSPTPANAGADATTCGLTYNLGASNAIYGSGMWSGSGTFADVSFSGTSVTVSDYGTYDFTWTTSTGEPCAASADVVTITFINETANATVITDDASGLCSNSFDLVAMDASPFSGVWSSSPSNAVFADATSNSTSVVVGMDGNYTFTWTVTGACGTYSDEVTVGFLNCNGSIGDTVFYDEDGDGMQDAGEEGIAGITVTITYPDGSTATTTTDSNGNYSFDNLTAGDYTVTVGSGPTDTNLTTAGSFDITLGAGEDYDDADFGFVDPCENFAGSCGPAQASICDGETITLTATGGSSYSWSTGATTQSITVSESGTYSVEISNADGCSVTASATITVEDATTVSAGADQTICSGASATLTASGNGSYMWNTGATTQSITVGVSGTYTVTLTDVNGCSASDSATITINDTPTVSAGGDQTICEGGTATLTATAGDTYSWSNGATTQSITVGAGTYTVTVTSNGCSGTASAMVTENSVPSASITGDLMICEGVSTTLTATGGSSYSWSTGATTQSITISQSGTYTVTVSSGEGCSATATAVVTVSGAATVSAGDDQTICSGTSATLTASGNGSYMWSTGATTQSITVGVSGTYTVTLTDANGCSASDSATVTINDTPTVSAGSDQTICEGGTATLTATAGDAYSWSNGATTQSITVGAGTYTVTVTSNGCSGTASATVTENSIPTASISGDLMICEGTSTMLTATGGSSYSWNTGATTQSITVSQSGTYTVTVSSGEGCSATATAVVTVSGAANISAGNDVTICAGGSITLDATGGASYTWSDGSTGDMITVSPSQTTTYTVTGTTAAGCSASDQVTVTVANNPTAEAGADQSVCGGENVTLTASGGDSYSWNTGETTQTITVSPSQTTTYSVTVSNNSGCSATDQVTVYANGCGTIGDYVWYDTNGDGIQDAGEAGIAGVPVTLVFPDGSAITEYTDANGSYLFTDLPAGDYTVIVGDGPDGTQLTTNGTDTVSLGQGENYTDADFGFNDPCMGIYVDAGSDVTTCAGQAVTLTADGNGINYEWSFGAIGNIVTFTPTETTTITVFVTTTDEKGECTATDDLTIFVEECGSIGDTVFMDDDGDGVQDAGENGIAGITVTLTFPNGSTMTTTTDANGNYTFDDLFAGDYTVTVGSGPSGTDLTTVGSFDVSLDAGEDYVDADFGFDMPCDDVYVECGVDIAVCGETTITLTATSSGGTITWSNGGTGNSITVNQAGSYTATITDENGCTATDMVNVVFNPNPIANAGADQVVCEGEMGTLTATGGGSYSWSNGATTQSITASAGTYTVTVTNEYGCTATDSATISVSTDANNPIAQAGPDVQVCGLTYIMQANTPAVGQGSWSYFGSGLTITDFNDPNTMITATEYGTYVIEWSVTTACGEATDMVQITFGGNPSPANAGADMAICGLSYTLGANTPEVGVGFWSTPDGITISDIENPNATISATSYGTYILTWTTTNCTCPTSSDEVTITFSGNPVADAGSDQSICGGSSATLTATGGGSYLWSTGATSQSITVSESGTYTVTVTNEAGCTDSDSATVSLNADPIADAGSDQSICGGSSATLTANGGGSYLWSTGATSQSITVSESGTYTVTVTNEAGCTDSDAATVSLNADPVADAGSDQSICGGSSATLTATGGGSYLWSTGATSQSITVSESGTYTVTVTNEAGCTDSDSATVSLNADPVADAGSDQSICGGSSATLTANGGGSYLWSTGATSQSITVSESGTYTVTVTNEAGCTDSDSATVSLNADPVADAGSDQSICGGSSATLTATGGGSYLWSTGATSQSITVSESGTYTVTVTNEAGCTDSDAATVSLNADPVADAGSDQSICGGSSATLTATGGGSYLWSTGATSQSITVSESGTYTVTVTNEAGCTDSDSATVSLNADPVADAGSDQSICGGSSATLTATGGGSYLWSTGATSQSITVSESGTYTVTVTNDAGCTDSDSATVSLNADPVADAGSDQSICGGSSATLTATGGGSYLWSTGATSQSITVSESGTYTVTVTNDAGCTDSDSATVSLNADPVADAGSDQSICGGSSATLTATGGGSYLWSTGATSQSITVSESGTYTVTVTNEAGCTDSDSATVSLNADPVADAGSDQSICGGSSATLTAIGGGSYLWSTGATSQSITVSESGTYTVTVTNEAGCTDSDSATVSLNADPVADAGSDQSICGGSSATLTANGGGSYLWSTGATSQSITVSESGTYTVTVTNEAGCTDSDSATVSLNADPVADAGSDQSICGGSSATLTATGGGSYLWSTGATSQSITVSESGTYTVTVTNEAGCTDSDAATVSLNADPVADAGSDQSICGGSSATLTATGGGSYLWSTGATSQSITVSESGTYTVTVTNEAGCTDSDAATVSLNADPIADAGSDQSICGGSSATLTATGGGSYLWSTGATSQSITVSESGTYTVTVTNEAGCTDSDSATVSLNADPIADAGSDQSICGGSSATLTANGGGSYLWSTGATSQSITVSESGTYTVTVTNDAGCTDSDSATVSLNADPIADAGSDQSICGGSSATLTATGGGSYLWSTGATSQSITVSESGTYTVTVTNEAGCTDSDSATVSLNADPVADAGSDQSICGGSSATLTATGGGSYLWSTGATSQSITVSESGTYTVTVTNEAGCTDSDSATVSLNADPVADAGSDQSICGGSSATLTATGGGSYLWSTGATSQSITVSESGTYTVTVTNEAGCTDSDSATVSLNADPVADAGSDQSICGGSNATLTANGGGSYLWSTGATSQSITVSESGTYTVTVTNEAGCTDSDSATVSLNADPVADAGSDQSICGGSSATLTATGGGSYLWSTGATSQSITVSESGTYTVTVTNEAGCTDSDSATVSLNADPVADAGSDQSICGGSSATLTATGGGSYLWSTGATSQSITVSESGTYTVTVTNDAGCTDSDSATVSLNADPVADAGSDQSICGGSSATLTATGGGSYLWSTGATSQSITVSESGTYTVTVTNEAGCTDSDAATVSLNADPVADAGSDQSICGGSSATLTATGGGSYLWSTGATSQSITVSESGTYTVTVTNEAGCTDSDAATVSLNADPVADAGSDQSICGGSSATLTATGGGSYLWSTGATSQSITVSESGTYTVTVTNEAGCTDSDSATVSLNADPVADAGSDQSICGGSSATLTATGGGSYLWSTGATSQSITVSESGTYTVTVTNEAGCTDSDSATVTISPNPSADAGADETICEGSSVKLTASIGESYEWSNGKTTQSITVSPTEITTYSVTVYNMLGCSDTDNVTVFIGNNPVADAGPDQAVCEGETATLMANGGSSYLWSNGETSQSITVGAGTYTVTVTNDAGCTDEDSATITVSDNPVADAGADQVICSGEMATLTATGGGSYAWSTGETSQTITVNAAGTYEVTVTNENGCSDSDVVSVTMSENPVADAGANQTICDGEMATLSANGGGSYLWSTGATSQTITAGAGTYTVTVTNAAGCSDDDSVTVSTGGNPVADAGADQSVCDGEMATLSANGGGNYLWSTGATSQTITVGAGTYTVTVTNEAGCTGSDSVMVTTGGNPVANAGSDQTVCDGEMATLTATGGGTYTWSTGATSQSITVSTGTYTVIVTNANGCTDEDSVTVSANAAPVADAGADQTVCDGGTATLMANGGSTYFWSNGETTQSITVGVGTYTVTVTNGDGCSDSDSATVSVSNNVVADAGADQVICSGEMATLTASGGGSYLWSTGATSQTITVNAAGTYEVTVTNADGCSDADAVTVTMSEAPVANAGGDAIVCEGGMATLTASGGGSYLWSTGATSQTITVGAGTYTVTITNGDGCSDSDTATVTIGSNPVANAGADQTVCDGEMTTLTANGGGSYTWSTGATSQTITVGAGTYTVTVTDANGCTDSDSVTVTTGLSPEPMITSNDGAMGCDEAVTLTATGGDNYTWSNGQTGSSIQVTTSGSYTVTATDVNGCSGSFTIVVTVEECGSIGDTVFYDEDGDGVQDAGEEGIAGVTVTLIASDGTTQTTTTDANGNYLFDDLPAGDYTVVVGNGPDGTELTTVGSFDVSLDAGEDYVDADFGFDDLPTGSIGDTVFYDEDGDGVQDAGEQGIASITVTLIAADGTTQTTTTDANGNYLFDDLPAGDYTVVVGNGPDGMDLTTAGSFDVSLDAGEDYVDADFGFDYNCSTTSVDAGDDVAICIGESTTITATSTGGTISWSNGETGNSITVNPSSTSTYTATVVDENGCSDSDMVTVIINPLPVPNVTSNQNEVACNEAISITAEGGVSYTWSTGQTTPTIIVSNSGTYTVTVMNQFGCTASESYTVTTKDCGSIGDTVFYDEDGDGVQDAGELGIAGVTVTLILPDGTTQTTTTDANGNYLFDDLPAGDYTVIVGNGPDGTELTTVGSFDVTLDDGEDYVDADFGFDDLPTGSIGDTVFLDEDGDGVQDPGEPGIEGITVTLIDEDGNMQTTTTDANGNYSFDDLPAGDYTVLVGNGPDGTSLTTTGLFNVSLDPGEDYVDADFGFDYDCTDVTVNAGDDTSICIGDMATLTANGSGETITWSNGETGNSISVSPSSTETYTATITDANGCSASDQVTVIVNSLPIAIAGANQEICAGETATLTATGGVSYSWNTGQTTPSIVVANTGTYTVTVTNQFGCSASDQVTVTGTTGNISVDAGADQEICAGETATLTATGNGSFMWNTGAATASITVSEPGTYTVTLTDANGCTASDEVVVSYTASANITVDAGADVEFCGLEYVLSATVTGANNGTWTSNVAGVTFQNVNSANTIVQVPSEGDYVFTYTANDGLCSSASDDVMITFAGQPSSANAGNDDSTCGLTYQLGATTPASGTGVWSGPGFFSDLYDPNATVEVYSAGSYTFTWTVNNCICSSTTDVTTITFSEGADISISGMDTTCPGNAISLTASGGNTYSWSNGMTGSTIAVSPSSTTVYTVTSIDVAGCSSTANFTVTVGNCGSIGDTVFSDFDGDGVQDAIDSGLSGIMVTLTYPNGLTETTMTDPNGNYSFDNLPAGNYIVTVGDGPDGYAVTTDSSFNVSLTTGEDYVMADFGFQPQLGSIGDYVWLDTDNDGIQDANESGIQGVIVTLYLTGGTTQTQVTDANGNYTFDGLMPGSYVVTVGDGPSGTSLTTTGSYAVTLAPAENYVMADFGFNGECSNFQEICTEPQTPVEVCVEFCNVDNALVVQTATTYNCSVVALGDNCLRYTPLPGLDGFLDTLVVTGCNAAGVCEKSYVNVHIGDCNINNAPNAQNDNASTTQGNSVSINPLNNDTDPDGDNIFMSSNSQPQNGTVGQTGSTFVYTPNAGFCGTDAFTYTICDDDTDNQLCTHAYVIINVECPNTPPANNNTAPNATDDNTSVQQGGTTSINPLTNDTDANGDDLSISGFTQPANGMVMLNGNGFDYTPNADFCGTDSFTYTVCDNGTPQACDNATITVSVACTQTANTPPVANTDTYIYDFSGPATINSLVNDYDADGDAISITDYIQPLNGTVNLVGGEFVYTPNTGFAGNDAFAYTICDTHGDCATSVVYLSLICGGAPTEPTNGNPTPGNDTGSTSPNTPTTICALDNDTDPDGDNLTMTSNTNSSNGSVTFNNGCFTYTPNSDYCGTDSFTYTVCDADNACGTATVSVSVACPQNNTPVANNDAGSTDANTPTTVCALDNDSDADGDSLTMTNNTNPSNGSVIFSNGCFTYTPNADYCGTDSFNYTVCDAGGECATATVSISVACPSNEPPVANDDDETTQFETPITISVLDDDYDTDGDAITITTVTQPANGTVTIAGNNVFYVPNNGFSGTDTFTYTICDEDGLCDTATVTVTVPDGVCTEGPGELCTNPQTPVEFCVNFCSLPGATIQDAFTTYHCSITLLDDNCLRYTPLPAFTGVDTISVLGCDAAGNCTTIKVDVNVGGCDGLYATNDDIIIDVNESIAIDVVGNDGGSEGIKVSEVTAPSNGAVVINNDRTVTYIPNQDYIGNDAFNYVVTDNNGDSEQATVFIGVKAIEIGNDDPTDDLRLPCEPRVSNAFTPNGDGINDMFTVKNTDCYANQSIVIYSQFGQEVFKSNNVGKVSWDGRSSNGSILTAGTYFCVITMEDEDGKTYQKSTFIEVRK